MCQVQFCTMSPLKSSQSCLEVFSGVCNNSEATNSDSPLAAAAAAALFILGFAQLQWKHSRPNTFCGGTEAAGGLDNVPCLYGCQISATINGTTWPLFGANVSDNNAAGLPTEAL